MRVDSAGGARRYRRDSLDSGLDLYCIGLVGLPPIFTVRTRVVGTVSRCQIAIDVLDVGQR